MGDFEGPEVTRKRTVLKRAQKDAQELPVEVQIREREAFIERARKRIAKIDEDRLSEVRSLEEAERKLIELRQLHRHLRHPRTVHQLRNMVSQLQAQVDSLRAVPGLDRQGLNPKRVCRREDLDGVAMEGFESGGCGGLVEVARISNLLTKAAAEWQEIIQEQGAAVPSIGNLDDKVALRGAPGEGRFAPY